MTKVLILFYGGFSSCLLLFVSPHWALTVVLLAVMAVGVIGACIDARENWS
jgi:hypothetical protein